jgi:ribosome-associated translation inhibitor RaiA
MNIFEELERLAKQFNVQILLKKDICDGLTKCVADLQIEVGEKCEIRKAEGRGDTPLAARKDALNQLEKELRKVYAVAA